jgi:hypothetical protein
MFVKAEFTRNPHSLPSAGIRVNPLHNFCKCYKYRNFKTENLLTLIKKTH